MSAARKGASAVISARFRRTRFLAVIVGVVAWKE